MFRKLKAILKLAADFAGSSLYSESKSVDNQVDNTL
jgi:hypothetical protein